MTLIIALILGIAGGIAIGYRLGGLASRGKAADDLLQLNSANASLTTALEVEKAKAATLTEQLTKFQDEAAERIRLDSSLNAVRESIVKISEAAQREDVRRAEAESSLKSQIAEMATRNESLLRETTKLAGALSHSQARGKYGEAQLEMLLESAGLKEGIHFVKQSTRENSQLPSGSARPDICINIPGGAEIFIDSKFPFDRFFNAVSESDPEKRREGMQEHAKVLLNHVNELSKKEYQNQGNSADYVVLFVPFESILSEALEVDPTLLHSAFEKKITIATPTTMLALLRTVAHVYSQSNMAENAEKIKELAALFLQRIGNVHAKIEKLGDTIKTTERAFNSLVQSAESNMLVPARNMAKLGVPSKSALKSGTELEEGVRNIKITQPAISAPNTGSSLELEELADLDELDDEIGSEVEDNE